MNSEFEMYFQTLLVAYMTPSKFHSIPWKLRLRREEKSDAWDARVSHCTHASMLPMFQFIQVNMEYFDSGGIDADNMLYS